MNVCVTATYPNFQLHYLKVVCLKPKRCSESLPFLRACVHVCVDVSPAQLRNTPPNFHLSFEISAAIIAPCLNRRFFFESRPLWECRFHIFSLNFPDVSWHILSIFISFDLSSTSIILCLMSLSRFSPP